MRTTHPLSIVVFGLLAACTAPGTSQVSQPVGATGTAPPNMQASFWLKGSPNNIQGCIAFDPQFTREHIFTLTNGQARVTAPGGLNTGLSLVRPGVYQTRLQLGALNLLVTADVASTPNTLTVQDYNLGCAWSAVRST